MASGFHEIRASCSAIAAISLHRTLVLVLMEETYRKKARHYLLAADEVRDLAVRVELVKLARNYLALADYVDRRHGHGRAHRGDQDQDTQKDS